MTRTTASHPGTISTLSSTYSTTVALSGVTAAARLCGWVDFNKNNNCQNGFEESCVNVASGADQRHPHLDRDQLA